MPQHCATTPAPATRSAPTCKQRRQPRYKMGSFLYPTHVQHIAGAEIFGELIHQCEDVSGYAELPRNVPMMTEALWPPKPKLLLMAVSIFRSRGTSGV